jgi:hypothetical protein
LDSTEEVAWAINSTCKGPKIVLELGKATDIDKSRVTFTIDTGCSINIIDELTYNTMHPKPNLQKSSTKAYAYNSKILIPIIGQFETRAMYDKQYKKLAIHVVEGCAGNLLGFKSIMEFNIINIVNSIETKEKDDFVQVLIKQYPLEFSNKIGKLKDHLVKLHINHAIKPVRQKHRPTAIHLRPGIEKAIKKMLDNDIMEPVRRIMI